MPTRAGIATALFGLLCIGAGRTFGIFELYIVAAAALALVGCAVVWVIANWRALQVKRVVEPARLHAGSTSLVTLALANTRLVPTPVAQVTDEVDGTPRADAHVPPLTRRSGTKASYRIPAERRGRIELGPMRTRITDPFGLASSVRASAPDTSVLVLPRYDHIPPPPQPSGSVASRPDRRPGRIGASGDEFSALRPYVVGDDLRKVHWPSTARSGDLVVRTEHVPEHGDSLVLLDVRARVADPDTFERMVSAATSVLIACFQRGDTVRFATTAGIDLGADDQAAFDRILDELAMVDQVATDDVRVGGRSGSADSAVLVLGSSDHFVGAIGPQGVAPSATLIVRFLDEGARSRSGIAALPSGRMAAVGHHDDFPTLWTQLIGPRAAR